LGEISGFLPETSSTRSAKVPGAGWTGAEDEALIGNLLLKTEASEFPKTI
jgi:hypothetical protein